MPDQVLDRLDRAVITPVDVVEDDPVRSQDFAAAQVGGERGRGIISSSTRPGPSACCGHSR